RIGIQYMIFPYFFFALTALIVTFRLKDVKVDSQPIRLKDVSQLARNFPFFIFLILMIILMVTHNANDNFIGLYIMELGGSERLIGVAWFVGVMSEAIVYYYVCFLLMNFLVMVLFIFIVLLFMTLW